MQKRIADPNVSQYAVANLAPMDEDDAPRAAAILAAFTEPVPVGTVERPWARAGRVALRAMALIGLALLTYLPTLFAPSLLDGEIDAYHHQPWPRSTDWTLSPFAKTSSAAPPLLRILLRSEEMLRNGVTTHRVAGIALHAAVTVFLWLILRRLNRPGGWLAAALFAVNPGSAAAVEWFVARGRLWGALFALVAGWLVLRGVGVPKAVNIEAAEYDPDEDPRGIWKWFAPTVSVLLATVGVLVMTGADLCQPSAAFIGPIVIVLVAWRRGLRPWDLLWCVPLLLHAVFGSIAMTQAQVPAGLDSGVVGLNGVLRSLWWTGRALQRVAWPFATADLSTAGTQSQIMATCGLGGAVVLGILALLLMRRKLGAGPAVAGVCFLLLLPTLFVPLAVRPLPGLTAAQQAAAASTYLIAIPVLVVVADLVVAGTTRWVKIDLTRRATEVTAAAMAIVALGCAGAVRGHAFADTETILKTAVRVNGRSWTDRTRLASWYVKQKRPDPAMEVMAGLTSENCPDAATALAQGDLLVIDGDLKGAMTWYQRGGQLAPDDPEPIGRESSTLVAMDRVGDAVDNYEKAIKRHPDSAALHYAFGLLLRGLNNLTLAESEFQRAVALDPEVSDQHVALAAVMAEQKRYDESAVELQEAVRLDPENFDAFHDAGLILLQLGAEDRAVRMLNEAVRLRPESAVARSDLAVAQIKLANNPRMSDDAVAMRVLKSAKFELEEALRLQPDFVPAQSNQRVLEHLIAVRQQRANVQGK